MNTIETEPMIAALEELCKTIESTGGVYYLDGVLVPAADPDWVDIAYAYEMACTALDRHMVIGDDDDDDDDNDEDDVKWYEDPDCPLFDLPSGDL